MQARVPLANAEELNNAAEAASAAFPEWSSQPSLRRARVLSRSCEIFERRIDEVAATINREHAKVFSDAKGEASRGREVVEFATGIPHLLRGEYTDQVGAHRKLIYATASGRGCWYYSLQLSCDGADVDVPNCAGLWQYLRSEAERTGPECFNSSSGNAGRSRPAEGCVECCPRR